jgi:geranial dehydrogenase
MLVPRAEVDSVVGLLRQKASGIVIGDPLAPTTTMGPMATSAHRDRVLDRVQAGRDEGASLVFGGARPVGLDQGGLENGWFVEPTLFVTDNRTSIAREEIFGPVVAVIAHDGDDDAVSIANDSRYGLGGSVFSADTDRARKVASRLATGSVTINGYTTNMLAPRNPFKESGMGTVTGIEGFRAFHSTRVVNVRAAQGAWSPASLFAANSSAS